MNQVPVAVLAAWFTAASTYRFVSMAQGGAILQVQQVGPVVSVSTRLQRQCNHAAALGP